ncbi:radial spoke head protein 3 homolog [Synchiropus splendidus]|uniref:radial spoke head protein 3 homolog n=1 Tax=Synchiropus splendidus TaxID=270530 RepID=UPI00237EE306|nr:radial spoke head protein 3 homolog [Synchiropus splendidus]
MSFEIHNQTRPDGLYCFTSRPRPAEKPAKYRKDPLTLSHAKYGKITYDRHAVRGSMFDQHASTLSEIQRLFESRRAVAATKYGREHSSTPEPVHGRKNMDVQTELYLEELSDVIETTDSGCQTDAFLDRPATPLFVPAKTGKDVATQIEDGELFDFDSEVQPLLEVLVGKTIEQSLLEVMEEEEVASLKAQQKYYEDLRHAELAEVQRLREQERRRIAERKRRMVEQKKVLEEQHEFAKKITAQAFTRRYLDGVIPSAFTSLREKGFFFDPVKRDIETNFMPCLMKETMKMLEKREAVRLLLDTIIYEVAQNN